MTLLGHVACLIALAAASGCMAADSLAVQDPFQTWWKTFRGGRGRSLSDISFEDVGTPKGSAQHQAQMSRQINISGETVLRGQPSLEENFHVLVKVGEAWRSEHPYDGDTFGQLYSASRKPIYHYDQVTGKPNKSRPFVSNLPDFASMIHKGGRTAMIVHVEDYPGATFLLELDRDDSTGLLRLNRSTSMDWSGYGGMWNPCAGTLSPWNTHLGAEEYDPDAKAFAAIDGFPTTRWGPSRTWANIMRYYDTYPVTGNFTAYRALMDAKTHPYMFGYIFEAGLRDGGGTFAAKRMAMGRKSGELAFVMPDRRTAYMTDDGTNTFLSIFVADTPGDLSAGHLYCARMIQTGSSFGGQFNVSWVDMGHAYEEDIRGAVFASGKRPPAFGDLFEESMPLHRGFPATCPEGFAAVHGSEGLECLKLRAGQQRLASRLETRRYAALVGCTTEWTKMEGFTYSADTGKGYVAMSEVRKGMEDRRKDGRPTDRYDAGTGNHVRLPFNPCGCVYELELDPLTHFATRMRGLLCGTADAPDPRFACSINGIANPDNLAAVHGHGALLIGEDSWRKKNNVLWKYDLETGALQERVASTPLEAEVSSPYFYPDIGGLSYITMVAQHPVAPGFTSSALGYATWPRHCGTRYPGWAMPGEGSEGTCAPPAQGGRTLGAQSSPTASGDSAVVLSSGVAGSGGSFAALAVLVVAAGTRGSC